MHWPACIFVLHGLIKQSHAELHRSVFLTSLLISACDTEAKKKIGFWGPAPPLPPLLISHWSVSHVADFPCFVNVCLCVPGVFSPVVDNGPRLWLRPRSFVHAGLKLHAWMCDKRQGKHWNWNLSRPPTISLAGRDISYASALWEWIWRNHTWSLGSFVVSPETPIWNQGKDEHVSKSMKNQRGLQLQGENREETMLLWLSYVSNQELLPWI